MADYDAMNAGGSIGEGAGDFLGYLISELINQGNYEAAEKLQREAAAMFDNIALPGELEKMGPTAYEQISVDPRIRQARMSAMEELLRSGLDGGMDPVSRAQIETAKQQAGQYEAGQRGAIMADAARRGLTGSNLSVTSQLQAAQGGADRVARAGIQATADARLRALQALRSSGDMAGGIERDEYGQQRDLAGQRDYISEFNTRVANEGAQQRFENTMDLQGARADAKKGEADIYNKRAERTTRTARAVGRGAGKIGGTIASGGML